MDRIDAQRLAEWAGGRLVGGAPAAPVGPDVVRDSREVTPGAVFVALRGERVDGHDFVAVAAAAGAGAALVDHEVAVDVPQVLVDDTVGGLSALARSVVADAKTRGLLVVGVTGSSGKTSTKDLIAQVLETAGPTVAPAGSFNNEIGAPLTACQVDATTRFLVAEMGARGIGHVAWLCGITPPDIGVVINVGTAHLGEFGSREGIAQAKGELVEAVPAQGWAVLNADDRRVAGMASRTRGRVALFSLAGDPAALPDAPGSALRVWASDLRPDELQRYSFTLHAAGAVAAAEPVRLRLLGEHAVANALAAAAVGLCAGLAPDRIAAALGGATTRSKWRMQLDQRGDGLAVLNDAYNANPDSMAKALQTVVELRRPGGRVIAVLGDMLELGEGAAEAHRAIGRLAADLGVDELVAVGGHGADLVAGFSACGRPARYWPTKDDAVQQLVPVAGPSDVVLVKASRGIGLETVAEALMKEGTDR
nr:UDP-N-acetylmuramoyl-tripeptide--D-alanyl-D-alanine ligase [Propionibacterium sp.]